MVNSTIYHGHLGYRRKIGLYDTYIHLSLQHQLLLHYCNRKSGWYLVTYINLYQHHYQDILRDYDRKSVWSQETYFHDLLNEKNRSGWSQENYVHVFHHPKTFRELLIQNIYHRYDSGRKNGWSRGTNNLDFNIH